MLEYFVDTNLLKSPTNQENSTKTLQIKVLRSLQVQVRTYCLFNSFVVRTQPSQGHVQLQLVVVFETVRLRDKVGDKRGRTT